MHGPPDAALASVARASSGRGAVPHCARRRCVVGKVKIGVGFSISRAGIPGPDEICAFAERVEELGLDSIWPSDHAGLIAWLNLTGAA